MREALPISIGAVGDVCLHFFDADGAIVPTSLEDRLVGLDAASLRAVPRIVAVAGGTSRLTAIRAALRGRWLTVSITDLGVANRLAEESD